MENIEAIQPSFRDYLLKNKRNRAILCIAAIAIIIQFVVFKYLYPYASFIHGDSFSYLNAAVYNMDINTYMIGYSRFLRLFNIFITSDTVLVAFQYLLLQSSVLFLLFTIFYFYRPGKVLQVFLLAFMVLNPLLLHLANLISSDNLFLSFSLIWFTLLLWIIHRPTTLLIGLHAVVLFIVFTLRYNALIYPFISILAFGLSSLSLRKKISGMAVAVLLVGLFVLYTGNKYKSLTGTWQYSPFSGWQVVNNAMYAYRYVDSANRKPVPEKFKALDNMVRKYFDTSRDVSKYPQEALMASTVYMWSKGLTLYLYRDKLFAKDTLAIEFKKWASIAPFYKEYGTYLIKEYPLYYIRYFIWPNVSKYYAPPVEFLSMYNSARDTVTRNAQMWFGYKTRKISTRMKGRDIKILDFYPILSGVINVVMLASLLCFTILKGFKKNSAFRNTIILAGAVWLLNAAFTISASAAALRFQSFPILLTTIFTLLLIDWMWATASAKSEVTVEKPEMATNEWLIANSRL